MIEDLEIKTCNDCASDRDCAVINPSDTIPLIRRKSGSLVSSTAVSKLKIVNEYDLHVLFLFFLRSSAMTLTASAIGSLSLAFHEFQFLWYVIS